jgi:large subunit ribosomal protein L10
MIKMAEKIKKAEHHVPEFKVKLVNDLAQLMDSYNIIGIVNMENLPAKQLRNMRAQLRGKVVLLMSKKRLIRLAIEKSKKQNIKELEKYVKGMPALLFTNDNPFALFKLLKKNKSKAPIKAGQKAPRDITVHAGATNFAPGPIIGELGSLKIKAGIEGGKVAIKEDKIVAKEGDLVDAKLAGLLTRLAIEPMEIGLNLVAVFENGEILTSSTLDIDEDAFMASIVQAASEAFNLAIFAAIPLKDTINALLSKAHAEAKAVAKEANIMTSENIAEKLAQADAEMNAIKAAAKIE